MANTFRFHWRVLFLAGFVSSAGSAYALSVQIKDSSNGHPTKIDFGVLKSTQVFNTAPQYLEITHPTVDFRRVYLFTDNRAGFGSALDGMVSTSSAISLPLHYRNYQSFPSTVGFTAVDLGLWPALIDASSSAFDAQKETEALLHPGGDHLSWVYLGLEIPPGNRGRGTMGARLVVEEWSDVPDVAGPVFRYTPFSNLILLNSVPVRIGVTLVDDSPISGFAIHYRMVDGPPGYAEAAVRPLSSLGAFSWKAEAELESRVSLRAPDVLEYYFTAVDTYTNVSESALYRANLVAENGTATLPYSSNAGGVSVAIGDPFWPGLEMQFPAGSVTSAGKITVGIKDPGLVPLYANQKPARVFQLGPENFRFSRPVSLLLPYFDQNSDGIEDGTGAKESDLKIFWFDGFEWTYVGGTVNPDQNQVRVNVTKLGLYALFPFSGSITADLVRPTVQILTFNPPNDSLHFNGVDATAGPYDIEIFDVRGSLVRKIHNSPDWDGRDESGRRVESGTYVYRFEGQGLSLSGMIAVAR